MDAMFDGEMRLFLEELCCELCRFRHAADNGIDSDEVNIAREVRLAPRNAFADIVVTLPAAPGYFVEIKYGLSLEETVRSIRRKYSANHRTTCNRLVVVVRDHDGRVTDAAARMRVLLARHRDLGRGVAAARDQTALRHLHRQPGRSQHHRAPPLDPAGQLEPGLRQRVLRGPRIGAAVALRPVDIEAPSRARRPRPDRYLAPGQLPRHRHRYGRHQLVLRLCAGHPRPAHDAADPDRLLFAKPARRARIRW